MRQNHTNYGAPINLESPIGKMPFGKYKGELIWTLPINQVAWMKQNLNLSERSIKTLDDGMEMMLKEGEYAVLRKFRNERWYVQLQGIFSSEKIAEAHTNVGDGFDDFVYHIVAEAVLSLPAMNRFLNELIAYADKQVDDAKYRKALRIYNKCMLRGHISIADAIKEKYGQNFPKSDLMMAFGMMLQAQKHIQNQS